MPAASHVCFRVGDSEGRRASCGPSFDPGFGEKTGRHCKGTGSLVPHRERYDSMGLRLHVRIALLGGSKSAVQILQSLFRAQGPMGLPGTKMQRSCMTRPMRSWTLLMPTQSLACTCSEFSTFNASNRSLTSCPSLLQYCLSSCNGKLCGDRYATPSEYLAAVRASAAATNTTFPVKERGTAFFPFNDWSGYYTSRPTLKGLNTETHAALNAVCLCAICEVKQVFV